MVSASRAELGKRADRLEIHDKIAEIFRENHSIVADAGLPEYHLLFRQSRWGGMDDQKGDRELRHRHQALPATARNTK